MSGMRKLAIEYKKKINDLEKENAELREVERQLAEAREAIGNILNITYDSEGVAGYHDNGNVALWEEFEEIQQLEEQLKEKG